MKLRELTQAQLNDGYLVQLAPILGGAYARGEAFDIESLSTERRDYVVVRKTDHGTYIVEEPDVEDLRGSS